MWLGSLGRPPPASQVLMLFLSLINPNKDSALVPGAHTLLGELLGPPQTVLLSKCQDLSGFSGQQKASLCLLKTHNPRTQKEKQESLKDKGRPAKQN